MIQSSLFMELRDAHKHLFPQKVDLSVVWCHNKLANRNPEI